MDRRKNGKNLNMISINSCGFEQSEIEKGFKIGT